jgi:hypothetical protein
MTERTPPTLRFEFGALLIVTALAAALRVARLSGLAPDLGEAAHFLTANPVRFLEPRAWSAALGAAAPAMVWAILRRGGGPWIALAAATITATTPWSVHASRSGTTLCASFVASLALFAAIRAARPLVALAVGGGAAALLAFAASKSVVTPQRIDPGAWLVADVGLGSLPFVLAAWAPRAARRRVAATFGAGLLCTIVLLQRYSTAVGAAGATACVVVLAASGLGGWWEAAERPLPRLAALAMAVVPSLPSLASEFIDGGRFDLERLTAAFNERRQSGDAFFASDAELAEHGFGVDCRPLPRIASAPADFLPADRAAWVLLLFDRGRPLGDPAGISPAIEKQLALVARTFKKRLDLHRFEARLYRSEPTRKRPP